MTGFQMDRRALLAGGLTLSGGLLLPACATMGGGGLDFSRILKDLLGISSQRAFARLLEPDGFIGDSLARLELPDAFGGSAAGGVASALLATPMVRERLLKQVNGAAGFAAKAAEPIVDNAIASLTFADAAAVLRGGPTAATGVLQGAIGDSLGASLVPSAARGLGVGDSSIVTQALKIATGFDINALAGDVGHKAAGSIFKAIGREEAAIRKDPSSTNNPALIAALTALG